MQKLSIWLSEAYKNLYKSILITLLTIFFLTSLFMFVSVYSKVFNLSTNAITMSYNETYLTHKQFYIGPSPTERAKGNFLYDVPMNATDEEKEEAANEYENFIKALFELQNENLKILRISNRSLEFFDIPSELKNFNSNTINIIMGDENFFLYESLPIMKGRSISKEDFDFQYISTNDNRLLTIPILAGYNFSKFYSVGDKIKINSDLTKNDNYLNMDFDNYSYYYLTQGWCAVYEIIGFIEEGMTFSNPSGIIMLMDNILFIPYKPLTTEFYPDLGIKNLSFRYSELSNIKIYIKPEQEEELARKINALIGNTSLSSFFMMLESFNESSLEILNEIEQTRKDSFSVIATAVFIFSIVGISIATINKFKGNLKDYGTHILLGATSFDISMMGVIEMSIQLLIADILIHLPFLLAPLDIPLINFINRNIPYFQSTQMYVMLGIANLVFIAVTVLCNLYCIKKYPLIEIIRRKE